MAEKKSTPKKPARPRKGAAPKKTTAKKAAVVHKAVTPAPAAPRPVAAPAGAEVCPRCGTATFAPEQRIRADGSRTVRYTILVCERGHTFAKPVRRAG